MNENNFDYRKIVEQEILEDILLEGRKKRKFKITVSFRENLSKKFKEALEMIKTEKTFYTEGEGRYKRYFVSYYPEDVEKLHKLWELINTFPSTKVYVNNYELPYAQSLWLLLFWVYRIR